MKFKKFTEVTKFQKKLLKPYNDRNTKLRSQAKNKLQENICKSINNNLSGKMVEDLGKRLRLITARTAKNVVENNLR